MQRCGGEACLAKQLVDASPFHFQTAGHAKQVGFRVAIGRGCTEGSASKIANQMHVHRRFSEGKWLVEGMKCQGPVMRSHDTSYFPCTMHEAPACAFFEAWFPTVQKGAKKCIVDCTPKERSGVEKPNGVEVQGKQVVVVHLLFHISDERCVTN